MNEDYENDPDTKLVELIQYGSPKEAAQALRDRDARQAGDRLAQEELARSTRELDKFRAENPDLDENAEAVVERRVFGLYLDDLHAAGFTDDQLPKNLNDIAHLHLRLRSQNHGKARKVGEIFKTAKQQYVDWKEGRAPSRPSGTPSAWHPELGGIFGADENAVESSRRNAFEKMRHQRESLKNPSAETLRRPAAGGR